MLDKLNALLERLKAHQRLRGNDHDREVEVPETALPEVANVIEVEPLRWGGRGNVIAAAGAALLDLAGVR